ncbi:MAG: GNAT family N-acetyltransferase [Candidatus Competibacter sp.]|nr:GNAT family N-acetyltransferase [Candidatus Competibacter sp.]
MSHFISVERIRGEDLEDIWPLCTKIAVNMSYPSFFCCGEWLKTAANALCYKNELSILVVKKNDCVKALLPLVSKRNILGGNDLHFLGTDFFPDPVGLICSPTDRDESVLVLKKYLLAISGWDRFIMNWVLQDEQIAWNLPSKCISTENFKTLPHDFNKLLGNFKKKKRYNLRAMARKFLDAGGRMIASTDRSSYKYFLDILFLLHQKRAEERIHKSTFAGSRVEAFHQQLIHSTDRACFYGLLLNQQIISVIYGFKFDNRFFYYQVAHDPDYADLSPGTVLLFFVIEDCCLKGVKEFNFLQGDESYKKIWTNESRALYRCVFSNKTWRSYIFDFVDQVRFLRNRFLRKMCRITLEQ